MTLHTWLIYVTLVIIATSSPGPAVLFIMTSSTSHGWKKSIFAASGNISGLFCLGILAITGLGTLLKTSEHLFTVIKFAGAGYLIYIGIKLLIQKEFSFAGLQGRLHKKNISSRKLFFQAFGVAMSNPKAILFLTALFPQFIDVHEALFPQFAVLISTLMVFSFSFLMLYAFLADRARIWLNRPSRMKAINRISGSLFISFGALLAASSNK